MFSADARNTVGDDQLTSATYHLPPAPGLWAPSALGRVLPPPVPSCRALLRRPITRASRAMAVGPELRGLRRVGRARVEVAAPRDAVVNFLVERAPPAFSPDVAAPTGCCACARSTRAIADGDGLAGAVRAYLHELSLLDAGWTASQVDLAPVPTVDWERVFRAHHAPLAVGGRLLIAPPWEVPDAAGREVLVIEPGMAFGTGQHATTGPVSRRSKRSCSPAGSLTLRSTSAPDRESSPSRSPASVPRVVARATVDAAVLPLAREEPRPQPCATRALLRRLVGASALASTVVANILADTLVDDATALAAALSPGGVSSCRGLLASRCLADSRHFPVAHHRRACRRPRRTLRLER